MKTVNLNIDYNSVDSIKIAERNKEELVDKGYKLVNTYGGMRFTTLVMGKVLVNGK